MTAEDPRFFKSAAETTLVQHTAEEVIALLESDAEFFINFYISEELEFPVPEFHKTSWRLLTSTAMRRIALALPREHAKTTLAKLAVVWYLLFTPYRFILYVSNTLTIAAEACKDIVNYMRSDNHLSVFGPLEFITQQDQRGFYKFKLKRTVGGKVVEKICILKPLGAEQQVRGLNIDNERPELAVVDDLESRKDETGRPINIDTMIKKRKKWFYSDFMPALSKRMRKIIYLANLISNKSLIHSFCQDQSGWEYMRFGMLLSDGKPLWPDQWSLEEIRQLYLEYQREGMIAVWFAEYMNIPIAEGDGLIDGGDIPYMPPIVPGEQEAAFITIDLSSKQNKWNDDVAIVCHALKNNVWRIVDTVAGKFKPDQIWLLMLEMAIKWNTRVVGIEDAGFQVYLKFIFEIFMVQYNQSFEFIMVPHHNVSKTQRIMAWTSALKKKIWALEEGDFAITEQLLAYDVSKTNNSDDIIDSCSMGLTMVNEYMPSIMQQFTIQGSLPVRSGYEVVSI